MLSGDILQVTPGGDRVLVMWSYPNLRPLSAGTVRRIAATIGDWRFARIYGAFSGREVMAEGEAVVAASAADIVRCLTGCSGNYPNRNISLDIVTLLWHITGTLKTCESGGAAR